MEKIIKGYMLDVLLVYSDELANLELDKTNSECTGDWRKETLIRIKQVKSRIKEIKACIKFLNEGILDRGEAERS